MSLQLEDRVLALDFGLERIGVALSYGSLAEPLSVLRNTPQLWQELADVCTQHAVTQILVGQSEQEMAERSKAFARELEQYTGLPVRLTDETLSTKDVERRLHERRQPGERAYRGPVDHFAAAHILQTYLDENL